MERRPFAASQRGDTLMALELITPPAVEPVTLTEAKKQCRVELDFIDEDDFISSLITSAREYCEGFSNRAYLTQTWGLWLDNLPVGACIRIPLPPLQSVTSIKYYDTANVEAIMAVADYFVDDKSEPGRVSLAYGKSWPSTTLRPVNGIFIEFVAGYGNAPTAVPKKVKQAMLLLIGYWYEHREAAMTGTVSREVEFSTHALLWQDRIIPV